MRDDEFQRYFQSYVAERVDQLIQESEKSKEYRDGKERLEPLIQKVKQSARDDDLEYLINAVRVNELPIERYCYQMGLLDAIQFVRFLDRISKGQDK